MKPLIALLGALVLITVPARADLPKPDPDDGSITLPPGFRALVVADNLVAGRMIDGSADKLRFLAVGPTGDLYAKTAEGGIFALRDSKGTGRADVIREFGSGGGTGVVVHGYWLYESTNDALYRYRLAPGELVPAGPPETVITGLPDGHQHNAKSFTFDADGNLFMEVGSPFNDYSIGDRAEGAKGRDATEFLKTHGGFWRFDPNRLNQTLADGYHYSTGHRHSLAVAWNPVSKGLFMVMMGRDQLNIVAPQYYNELDNAERVAEEMHLIRDGTNLGWPYTYWDPINKARMVSPEFGGDNRKRAEAGKYDPPLIAFPGHWAPLQMAFYFGTQFPMRYRGGAFIAFHGSWNRAPLPQAGYRVAYVPFDEKGMPVGTYETFADGFTGLNHDFTNTNDARFRPCGLVVGPDGSLYVGDSEKGRIWRIIYTGDPARGIASAAPAAAVHRSIDDGSPGARLYSQTCALCHMADGSGVSNMQPALIGDPVIGEASPDKLIAVVLRGPAAVLPADRTRYANAMPAFSTWSDLDIAELSTFLRKTFATASAPVSAEDVRAVRGGN